MPTALSFICANVFDFNLLIYLHIHFCLPSLAYFVFVFTWFLERAGDARALPQTRRTSLCFHRNYEVVIESQTELDHRPSSSSRSYEESEKSFRCRALEIVPRCNFWTNRAHLSGNGRQIALPSVKHIVFGALLCRSFSSDAKRSVDCVNPSVRMGSVHSPPKSMQIIDKNRVSCVWNRLNL